MKNYRVFKEGVKLVALMQATLEQMDELKGTTLHRMKVKRLMGQLERELEASLQGPLRGLDSQDPELLTKIQGNIEVILDMDLEEIAMLREELETVREQ